MKVHQPFHMVLSVLCEVYYTPVLGEVVFQGRGRCQSCSQTREMLSAASNSQKPEAGLDLGSIFLTVENVENQYLDLKAPRWLNLMPNLCIQGYYSLLGTLAHRFAFDRRLIGQASMKHASCVESQEKWESNDQATVEPANVTEKLGKSVSLPKIIIPSLR